MSTEFAYNINGNQNQCKLLRLLDENQITTKIQWNILNDTHRENRVKDSVQEFTEIEAWLLLSFFLCLHN